VFAELNTRYSEPGNKPATKPGGKRTA